MIMGIPMMFRHALLSLAMPSVLIRDAHFCGDIEPLGVLTWSLTQPVVLADMVQRDPKTAVGTLSFMKHRHWPDGDIVLADCFRHVANSQCYRRYRAAASERENRDARLMVKTASLAMHASNRLNKVKDSVAIYAKVKDLADPGGRIAVAEAL